MYISSISSTYLTTVSLARQAVVELTRFQVGLVVAAPARSFTEDEIYNWFG